MKKKVCEDTGGRTGLHLAQMAVKRGEPKTDTLIHYLNLRVSYGVRPKNRQSCNMITFKVKR